jgi:predicted  nucleic acid-binding Zn-ribbon protein
MAKKGYEILRTACPTCGAQPGQHCRSQKDGGSMNSYHPARHEACRNEDAPIKRVVRYVAEDGTEHATHSAARKHNTDTALVLWLTKYLDEHTAHQEMLFTPADLAAALRGAWNVSRRKE